jgi:ATP-dependent RNA helicase RhlE
MKFTDLQLIDPILKSLAEQGYETPTPIQQQSIPLILEGSDLLGCAQTGTGKTAAFSIPMIQLMHQNERKSPKPYIRALILTPTRELAIQIAENFAIYGKYTNLKHTVIFGGVNQHNQVNSLHRKPEVLIATPGRLLDLIGQGFIKLGDLEFFVLDEADRMLDMGFVHDVKKILKLLPPKRQSLFFSATMPKSIVELANGILDKPKKVEVTPVSSTAETIQQCLYYIDKDNKKNLLVDLIKQEQMNSVLVFTRTKHGADRVVKDLVKAGIKSAAIHGNKSQNARQNALSGFKSGEIKALIATDIAARGIDVDSLSFVINYEMPNVPETYVHRIGRTGRAGASGKAFSFCDIDEKAYVKDIQKVIGLQIPLIENHPYPMEVFELSPPKPQGRGGQQRQQRPAQGKPKSKQPDHHQSKPKAQPKSLTKRPLN